MISSGIALVLRSQNNVTTLSTCVHETRFPHSNSGVKAPESRAGERGGGSSAGKFGQTARRSASCGAEAAVACVPYIHIFNFNSLPAFLVSNHEKGLC